MSTDAGPAGPAALEPAAAAVAAGATAAALLGAAAAAALVVAGAAALDGAAIDGAALFEAADFLLAQPATKSAAIPRKTVALIAGEVARITFFILWLPYMWLLGL
jgi:hypothetical protein